MTDLLEKLNAKFPSAVKSHTEFRDQLSLTIDPDQFHDVALFLRDDDDAGFDLLVDVYGLDRRSLGVSPHIVSNYEFIPLSTINFCA
jgi:NADH:ubiquinone oxidoreductase subunit C